MAAQTMARPVSGEIMTGPDEDDARGMRPLPAGLSHDIVDADFVTLSAQPHRAPHHDAAAKDCSAATGLQPAQMQGMAVLRKDRPSHARPFSTRGGPAFWLAGILIAGTAFWIGGGHALVMDMEMFREAPQTALSISAVTSRVDDSGARPLLLVDGEAGNDGAGATEVPPLEIRVTGEDGRITRYRLGTSGRSLAPGERFSFSGRVEVPRSGVTSVSVAFTG